MLVKTRGRTGCMGLLVSWLGSAAAVTFTAELLPGVHVDSFERALVVALVLGLLNALVRPLLIVLTLPVTLLTLGLFLIVINGAMVGLASWLLDGFVVDGFLNAVLASLLLTIISALIGWVLEKLSGAPEDD